MSDNHHGLIRGCAYALPLSLILWVPLLAVLGGAW